MNYGKNVGSNYMGRKLAENNKPSLNSGMLKQDSQSSLIDQIKE